MKIPRTTDAEASIRMNQMLSSCSGQGYLFKVLNPLLDFLFLNPELHLALPPLHPPWPSSIDGKLELDEMWCELLRWERVLLPGFNS
jgi:hypothetical protein